MSEYTDAMKRVKDSFVNRRSAAYSLSEARKAELYEKLHEIREIDTKLAGVSFDIMSAITAGADVESSIERLKMNNESLRERRKAILTANGYPADYSDIKFSCTKCNDSGYVGIDMCSCMKREMAEAALEASGIGRLGRSQNFDSFRLDYYTGEGLEDAKVAYRELKSFAENFNRNSEDSWLLIGDTGLGKTHLSTAVALEVISRGFEVTYETMQTLMDDFSENQFRGGDHENVRKYYDADLLIVDDLGSELTNQFTVSVLYNLINRRANKQKPTIFSTNLTQKELRERYADRIVSRLFGMYRPLRFRGTDIRRQKLSEGRK